MATRVSLTLKHKNLGLSSRWVDVNPKLSPETWFMAHQQTACYRELISGRYLTNNKPIFYVEATCFLGEGFGPKTLTKNTVL